jgi:hypothetical protein
MFEFFQTSSRRMFCYFQKNSRRWKPTVEGRAAIAFLFCELLASILFCALFAPVPAIAADVTVDLSDVQGVTFVGAIERWDQDGNHRKLPDSKAAIDAPAIDATAVDQGHGRWVFKNLSKGTYDLVILADGHRRYEGFQFVPAREFDPFFKPDMGIDDETRETVIDNIKKSPQYENIVEPLYLVGDTKAVRVLMMLVRDKPTSYQDIPNASTIRHEIWQYSWKYGGWQKEKRTKVMDRIVMDRNELRKWTWVWDPKLGGIEVGGKPIRIQYSLPKPSGEKKLKGLYPD